MEHKVSGRIAALGLTVLLTAAMLPANAGLTAVGPVDPVNGFPQWYQDSVGLALALCLTGTGDPATGSLCLFDPPEVGNAFSQTIGFGAEAFYWIGEAAMDVAPSAACPTCGGALLVLAMEAAWANETPVPGDQFPFGRLRIRIDTPVAGHYSVITPFGRFEFDAPAGVRAINMSSDIGSVAPDFTGPLGSDIGPRFLTWDSDLPIVDALGNTYIGDPGLEHTVIGSVVNNDGNGVPDNVFTVIGPPGSDLDGLGNRTISTNLFAIMGQVTTAEVPVPITVDGLSYSRVNPGQIDAFVESLSTATITIGGTGLPTTTLDSNGAGNFFGQIALADSSVIPATVTFMGTDPDPLNTDNSRVVDLNDLVSITRAEYNIGTGMLTVDAHSSDQAVPPTLTAVGLGNLVGGTITAAVGVPMATVQVVSSAGGSDTERVVVVGANAPGAVCGNSIVEAGETCDDGNTVSGDGCSATCQTEVVNPVCGNGIVEAPETCDDGNVLDGDGCSATCQTEVVNPVNNLLTNGSFDDGTAGWRFATSGVATFSAVGGTAQVAIDVASTSMQLYQFGIPLTAGTTYRVTLTGRNTVSDDPRILVIQHTAPFTRYVDRTVNFGTNNTTTTFEFTMPVNQPNARFQIWLGSHNTAGTSYFFENAVLEALP